MARVDGQVAVRVERPLIEISGDDLLLQASHRDGMSLEQARDLLERYPDGFLQHDAMDVGSFVVETRDGTALFYHAVEDSLTPWDWEADPAEFGDGPSAWSYSPADEMGLTKGGMDWWNGIRNGELDPASAIVPGLAR